MRTLGAPVPTTMTFLGWTRALAWTQQKKGVGHVNMVPAMAKRVGLAVRSYTTQKSCAQCGTSNPTASLQCNKCQTLQPLPSSVDYYEVLGMPWDTVPKQGWQVDLGTLKSQWRRTMALTHPDRLVNKPVSEQEMGANQSTILNKAYETLRQPLSRVLYLVRADNLPSVGTARD